MDILVVFCYLFYQAWIVCTLIWNPFLSILCQWIPKQVSLLYLFEIQETSDGIEWYSSKSNYHWRGNLMFLSKAEVLNRTSDIFKKYWIITAFIVEAAGEWFPSQTPGVSCNQLILLLVDMCYFRLLKESHISISELEEGYLFSLGSELM